LDAFILEQRQDEFYSASFTAHPEPAKVYGIGTLKITEEQRSDIATGKIVPADSIKQTATVSAATVQPNEQELDEMIRSGKVGK
jgi:hypothetical protein